MRKSSRPLFARLLLALALVAVFWFQAYAIFFKRSGETAYLPSDTFLSPEIAGEVTLQQTFVMHADGLETIRLYPARSAGDPRGLAQLTLMRDNWIQPFAVSSWPAARLLQDSAFDWHVPRVEQSAGRTFTIRVSVPDAPAGHGVRFQLGAPQYVEGNLFIGPRTEWGDLHFETRARRARVIDTVAALRRQTPFLRWEPAFAMACIVFNAALVVLTVHAIRSAGE